MDFDNIVEEEETNCKKRFQDICNVIERFTKQEFKIKDGKKIIDLKIDSDGQYTALDESEARGMKMVDVIFTAHYYESTVPEEVYCKALEIFDEIWASPEKYDVDTSPDTVLDENFTIRHYNYQWMRGIRIFKMNYPMAAIYFATSFGDNYKIILNNKEFTKEELFEKVKGILP